MTVRTRFAPSPTGYLHIGGVRTALFNWLFSRRHGGTFVLRIDDTDVKRNVSEALEPILAGFRWLGLDWDEGPEVGGEYGPYYQSQRQDLYEQAVDRLLERGVAYRDYATVEEIGAEREAAQAAGDRFVYSRKWAAETVEQQQAFAAEGRQGVVRLKMPREGVCRFTDLIRGNVEFEWAREQDHVIQRADGSCLYHLASVADDDAMAITHVVRAEEHLSNTPRQIFIAQGLGVEPPIFAHLPYVAEPGSKHKLSKRKLDKYLRHADFAKLNEHGQRIAERAGLEVTADSFNPVVVDFYEEIGFLPDSLINYLLLLGWSLDDRTEFFTREEMVRQFSLERVNRSPASFDPVKLESFQEHYMQELPEDRKLEMALPFAEGAGWSSVPASESEAETIGKIIAAAGDRIKVAGDILDYDEFFLPDAELPYEEKPFEKRLRKPEEAAGLLTKFAGVLRDAEIWQAAELESLLRDFVEAEEIKIGQVIHALRVAVTGKAVGFGMFEILELLGRDRSLARIERAISLI